MFGCTSRLPPKSPFPIRPVRDTLAGEWPKRQRPERWRSVQPVPLWVDMDPGVDDALAVAYLARCTQVEVVGASAVFGNAPVEVTARNLKGLLHALGLSQVPVHIGAAQPLAQEPHYALEVHGDDGLGGESGRLPHVPSPTAGAVEALLRASRRHGGKLWLLATGPLTNLAMALTLDPSLPDRVPRVYLMGGAYRCAGNATPYAEANVANDPEAADRVFTAGWEVWAVGLDVTRQVLLEEEGLRAMARSSQPFLPQLAAMAAFYVRAGERRLGRPACPLHDPLAVLMAVRPELFTFEDLEVRVETQGRYTRGLTAVLGPGRVHVATAVDARAAAQEVFRGMGVDA
jgi:purine nucleosidase